MWCFKLKKFYKYISILLAAVLVCTGCSTAGGNPDDPEIYSSETVDEVDNTSDSGDEAGNENSDKEAAEQSYEWDYTDVFDLTYVPVFSGEASVTVNSNIPFFTEEEITTEAFEYYSGLDDLGRCQSAFANICTQLMPTEEREDISSVTPTGWHSVTYDQIVEGNLYNRCHLIGFQLAGENANGKNLITGTRYMNVSGMLPYENEVAEYVKETDQHVLYRVTPVFEGSNLLASGVLMEAYSVEDAGEGVCFCVYCYNVQPGITIDYSDGSSSENVSDTNADTTYVVNTNSMKFHDPSCSSVDTIAEHNKKTVTISRETLIEQGYSPCKNCNP